MDSYIPIQSIVKKQASSQTASIKVQLPTGYSVESLPSTEPIETPYGKYSLQFEKGPESITIKRMLEINSVNIPAAQYGEWRDFYKKVAQAEGSKLVLVNKT